MHYNGVYCLQSKDIIVRLDQFISQATYYSRKDVKLLIKQQRITVNGITAKNNGEKITTDDVISCDNNKIAPPSELFFMLYKPAGYCCSHIDDGGLSAIRLLPNTPKKLHFAGRLDNDTTGLVLLSSDGAWCHRVTSPKQKQEKRQQKYYQVELELPLSNANIQQLEQGILLNNETKTTLPANIQKLSETCYVIAISEGKYHQVKRMFASVGNHVKSLHRFKIADITLDTQLKMGEYRPLTLEEIQQFNYDA